jgi:hypothetical protein
MKSQKNEFPILCSPPEEMITCSVSVGTVFDPEKIVVTSDDIIIPFLTHWSAMAYNTN